MGTINQSLLKLFQKATPGSDFQKLWFGAFVSTSTTTAHAQTLKNWLSQTNLPQGFDLDQDKRWSLVAKLQELDHSTYGSLLESETKRDPSSKGEEASISAKALANDIQTKKDILKALKENDWLNSTAKKRAAAKAVFPISQLSLVTDLQEDLYKLMLDVSKMPGEEVLFEEVTRFTLPLDCSKKSVDRMGAFIKNHDDLHPLGMKNLKIKHQEHGKCVAIKASQQNMN